MSYVISFVLKRTIVEDKTSCTFPFKTSCDEFFAQSVQNIFPEKVIRNKNSNKNHKKNDTNAKHPQMFTYKIVVVSAEEARDGGGINK